MLEFSRVLAAHRSHFDRNRLSRLHDRKPSAATSSSWFASSHRFQQRTYSGTSRFGQQCLHTSACRCKTGGKHCKCPRESQDVCYVSERCCHNRRLLWFRDILDEYCLSSVDLYRSCSKARPVAGRQSALPGVHQLCRRVRILTPLFKGLNAKRAPRTAQSAFSTAFPARKPPI